MTIKDATMDSPDVIRTIVGETIIGVIQNYDGRWWLIVRSGHAFVFGGDAYCWVKDPDEVRVLIVKRRKDLKVLQDLEAIQSGTQDLTLVDDLLDKSKLS